jgi:hypothetical protein
MRQNTAKIAAMIWEPLSSVTMMPNPAKTRRLFLNAYRLRSGSSKQLLSRLLPQRLKPEPKPIAI